MSLAKLALAFTLVPVASSAFAVESTVTSRRNPVVGNAELYFASSDVGRGRTNHQGAVMQPSLTAKMGSLSLGVTGNQALDKREGELAQEVYFSGDYRLAWEPLTVTFGTCRGSYPDTNLVDDQEVSVKTVLNMPFNPRISINRGVDGAAKGFTYYELGTKENLYAQGAFAATLGGALGYSDRPKAPDGFRHLTLTAAAAYSMMSAAANYVIETDKKVNDLSDQQKFYLTTSASFNF